MGVGIYGPPNVYNAGLDFDYSVWTAGTKLDLVNVAWNNDYRDVVKFASKAALNEYINSLQPTGVRIEDTSYAKPGQDVYLPIPYNAVNRYNYLRASNPTQPIPEDLQKDYYYFILECEYIAPNNTRLRLQLDVWQTYVYDVTFGNCYVERGHIGIANENAFNNYGRDYLTIPEGLDIGSEYREVDRRHIETVSIATDWVLAVSSVDLIANAGTASDPILVSAGGSVVNSMPSGAGFYLWNNTSNFIAWMVSRQDEPWVTQGIMSITIIPNPTKFNNSYVYNGSGINPGTPPAGPTQTVENALWENWRDEIVDSIPSRYRHLLKFLTFPYLAIELTTYNGAPVAIKPESWGNDDAIIDEMANIIPPNQRIAYVPRDYNGKDNSDSFDRDGDWLNVAVYLNNFPTLPIVNNGAISYLAANKHSIGWQKSSADWTQQRALGMAAGQYDITTGAMHAAMNLSGIGVNADISQTGNQNRTLAAQAVVNATNSAIGGIGTALTPGGFAGSALTGVANGAAAAINAGIQTAANDEALSIRNTQAAQTVQTQNRQSQLMRDTNKDLADWAARGDYGNQIDGINAKVQDAALIQPSVNGQYGGDTFNLVNQLQNFVARWKMIDNANIRIVGEIWLRYGYKIRAFIQPPQSLKVMTKFTYWKMVETYISSSLVPEGFKQSIRGILEKGVTVWDNPNDIGVIDMADNKPLPGVSY